MQDWPSDIDFEGVDVRMLDFGRTERPSGGGASQHIERAGNRHLATFYLPPLKHGDKGRRAQAALLLGCGQGLRVPWPTQGVNDPNDGDPVTSGGNRFGTQIQISGLTSGYTIKDGQMISIEVDGNSFLYTAVSGGTATNGDPVDIIIEPPLRVDTPDGSECRVSAPIIEGIVVGDANSRAEWRYAVANMTRLNFQIEEIR
jgi:hypothetical protein